MEKPGRFRTSNVGIVQGSKVAHLAPPAGNVDHLMSELFQYLKKGEELVLVKSCVFHYELEFIHPFLDGNGRMGRLWQTIILMQAYPIFEYLPFETMIRQTQQEYYASLSESDKAGKSTVFIEYMLKVIDRALAEQLDFRNRTFTSKDRLEYFLSQGVTEFSRKDYLKVFKDLSTATASRDLKEGVESGLLEKEGDKRNTVYKVKG